MAQNYLFIMVKYKNKLYQFELHYEYSSNGVIAYEIFYMCSKDLRSLIVLLINDSVSILILHNTYFIVFFLDRPSWTIQISFSFAFFFVSFLKCFNFFRVFLSFCFSPFGLSSFLPFFLTQKL